MYGKKPPQYCKVISLQLKKKKVQTWTSTPSVSLEQRVRTGENWLSDLLWKFFFFFLKQTKLNYRLLEGAPAAGLWGSVPRALFSLPLFFFSASPAISVQVLCSFNDGLKSESGGGGARWGGGVLGPKPASCILGK